MDSLETMVYVGDIKTHKVYALLDRTERILTVECPNGYFFQYRLTPESFREFPSVDIECQNMETIFPKGIAICEFGACRPDKTQLLLTSDISSPIYWDVNLFSSLDYMKVGKILWSIDHLVDDISPLQHIVLKNTIEYV